MSRVWPFKLFLDVSNTDKCAHWIINVVRIVVIWAVVRRTLETSPEVTVEVTLEATLEAKPDTTVKVKATATVKVEATFETTEDTLGILET